MFLIITKNTPPLPPQELNKAHKRFEWLISFLICRFKFVHQILGMMKKVPLQGMGTVGVRVTSEGKFELAYDPVWVNSLTDAEATYVFYHEILHLALHHCTRRPLSRDIALQDLANVAHDLAVNELIPVIKEICEPPRDKKGNLVGQFVSEYKKIPEYKDIEERQTAEWYFDYLRNKSKDNKGGGGKKGKGNPFDSHADWQEHEIADERVKAKIKQIDSNDLWGDVTQTQKELILAAQVRRINWRNKIRVWFGNMAWKTKMTTRKRPNRRTGWIHPGSKTNYVDRWLVAADTSGSINNELLAQWIGVLNQLAEELPIDTMQFDCEKTEDPKPYDRRQTKFEFKGRGGTDFQPVINIVDKRRYKGVMILTDGEASAPTKPKNTRVLWVLPAGHNPPVEWGDRVHLVQHA